MKSLIQVISVAFVVLGAQAAFASNQIWGGRGVQLNTVNQSARFSFDCADGVVDSGWVVQDGFIDALGSLTLGHGGPSRPGEVLEPIAARYQAQIQGNRMILIVSTAKGSQRYQLLKGQQGQLMRCL